MSVGFTIPFQQSSGSLGYFKMTQNELDATRENIRSLIFTNWGERPMHFYFGFNMREFMFEPLKDETLRSKIGARAKSQLEKWMPYVRLEQLNIIFTSDDSSVPENAVKFFIKFRLRSKPDIVGVTTTIVTTS